MEIETIKEEINYIEKKHFVDYISSKLLYNPNKQEHKYDNSISLLNTKKDIFIIQRIGKCNPGKCNSACCKFCSASYITDYSKGFFEKDEFGNDIIKTNCNNLMKCNKCKLWGKKLPNACKQFPHIGDSIYWNVIDVCTFRYKILHKINRVGDRIRKEMIKCFVEQGETLLETNGN